MSHLIIQPYDVVIRPEGQEHDTWHGLDKVAPGGVILTDGSNIPEVFCPIVATGFTPDFDAPVSDAPAELMTELKQNPITGWQVLLADLRMRGLGVFPIHVAKESYRRHQNKALFDAAVKAAQSVLGDKFKIVTVGTLGAYSQFFMSIEIPDMRDFEIDKGDTWRNFFNVISSHNSLVASQALLSVVRMVCMNTVRASIDDADKSGYRTILRHTENSESLLTPELFEQNLKLWLDSKAKLKGLLEAARQRSMSIDEFKSFAAGVFTNETSDSLSTTSFNRIDDLASLFVRGAGNRGETLYDAINAFTEYFTHGRGLGDSKRVDLTKRICSANFGRGNDWKLQALNCASTEESLNATIKRGERLFNDKVRMMIAHQAN